MTLSAIPTIDEQTPAVEVADVDTNLPLVRTVPSPPSPYNEVGEGRLPIAFRPVPPVTDYGEWLSPSYYPVSLLEDASGELPRDLDDAVDLIVGSLKDARVITQLFELDSWDKLPAEYIDGEEGGEKGPGDRVSRATVSSARHGESVYEGADGKIIKQTSVSVVGFAGEGELLLDDVENLGRLFIDGEIVDVQGSSSAITYYVVRTKKAALSVVK